MTLGSLLLVDCVNWSVRTRRRSVNARWTSLNELMSLQIWMFQVNSNRTHFSQEAAMKQTSPCSNSHLLSLQTIKRIKVILWTRLNLANFSEFKRVSFRLSHSFYCQLALLPMSCKTGHHSILEAYMYHDPWYFGILEKTLLYTSHIILWSKQIK